MPEGHAGPAGVAEEIGTEVGPLVLPRFPFDTAAPRREQRDAFRTPLTVPAFAVVAGGEPFRTSTLNLSITGAAFVATAPLGRGDEVELEVILDGVMVALRGQVTQVRDEAAGMRFERLGPTEERAVARVVAAQDRRLGLRARVTTSMRYHLEGRGGARRTTTSDLCLGGVRFHGFRGLGVGDRVETVLHLGTSGCAQRGTVFRVDPDAEDTGDLQVAVCFDLPSSPTEERAAAELRAFLTEHRSLAG